MTENLHQQCVLELEREKSLSKSLGESLSETKRRLAQLQLESEALQKQIKELLGQLSARRVNDEDLKDAEARAIQTLADAKRVYESDIARVRSECEAKTENSLKLLRSESVRDKALVEELKKQLARAGASKGKEADQKSEAIIAQKNEILLLQRQLAESMQAAATIASQQSTEIAALRKQLASAREAEAALRVASADLEQRATHLSRNLSDATRQLEDANAALQADRKAAAEQEAIRSKREAGLEKQHAKDLMELAALKASVDEQASTRPSSKLSAPNLPTSLLLPLPPVLTAAEPRVRSPPSMRVEILITPRAEKVAIPTTMRSCWRSPLSYHHIPLIIPIIRPPACIGREASPGLKARTRRVPEA